MSRIPFEIYFTRTCEIYTQALIVKRKTKKDFPKKSERKERKRFASRIKY
jgi:hypothetical protein